MYFLCVCVYMYIEYICVFVLVIIKISYDSRIVIQVYYYY